MGKLVDTDELYADFRRDIMGGLNYDRILREAKPVDAVPVVHGRWTDKDGGIATCSVCGDRWGVWSVMKYCPECGAKMDGKDGDS